MVTFRIQMETADDQDRRVHPRYMTIEVDGRRRIVRARIRRRRRRRRIRQRQDQVGLDLGLVLVLVLDLGRDPGLRRPVANPAEIEDEALVVNKGNVHVTIRQLVMPVLGAAALVAAGKLFH